MNSPSRYVVGLDLGTTNSAVAYVDTNQDLDKDVPIAHVAIPQVSNLGEVTPDVLLPSFLYLAPENERAGGALDLPWTKGRDFVVGKFARDHGSLVPVRLVSSAKSWLCHPGIDRRGKILPWNSEPEIPKISPLDAAARYLEHLRDAWNHQFAAADPSARLEEQDIVLTVPASFDAVARELTAEAARAAGLQRVTLFEEPQAAFYAWIHDQGERWRKVVKPGDVALVLDVGGGTTDLTLIGVGEHQGDLALTRLAVGEHLLLGGDNMDLTLAHEIAQQLSKKAKLDAKQMLGVWHACRGAKEKIFRDPESKPQPITVLGRGSKVIGGTLRAELTRTMVEKTLMDGFFPLVELGSMPKQQRGVGLQELGLGYAADPGITRHLSAFLGRHAREIAKYVPAGAPPLPSTILFNGGVFFADPLRRRVLEVLGGWGKDTQVRELASSGFDSAVARGAAYYGLVRRGRGVRIRGGVARSYYLGVETAMPTIPGFAPPMKALCVVPQGLEEGTDAELPQREFGLVVGEPVEFRFLSSTQRRQDTLGTMIDEWDETIEPVSPVQTTLPADDKDSAGKTIPVKLHTKVTEVGTLELWFQSRDGRKWKLEFNVREQE